jgi:hypothetical protein
MEDIAMKRNRIIQAILVLLIATAVQGCTAIGYGVGSAIDHSGTGDFESDPPSVLEELDTGDSIVIVMESGTSFSGRFLGVMPPVWDSLLVRAERAAPGDCSARSDLHVGDRILLRRDFGEAVDAVFLGADDKGVLYRRMDDREVRVLRYDVIRSMEWCGGVKHLKPPFHSRLEAYRIPGVEIVRVQTGEGMQELPFKDIVEVFHRTYSRLGRGIGTYLGACVDVCVLIAIALETGLIEWRLNVMN